MAVEPLPTSDGRGPREPASLGQGIDRVLRGLGAPSGRTVGGLGAQWEEIVGSSLASHTRPMQVRDGVLSVAVDDPAWAEEVRWMGTDLVRRIHEILNDDSVKRIEVRVRDTPG